MTVDSPRLRIGVYGVVVVSLFAALLARLWYLQVLSAEEFQVAAITNAERVVYEEAPRGRILDRNSVELVRNRVSQSVAIDTAEVSSAELQTSLNNLSSLFGVEKSVLEDRLEDPRATPYTAITVLEEVDEVKAVHIGERQDEYPGVVTLDVTTREYPYGSLAAHVLGYVGEINDTELAADPETYRPGDHVGKSGVEQAYEADLRGTPGRTVYEVGADGVPLRVKERTAPVPGDDVVLSIDLKVQQVAEQSLEATLIERRSTATDDKTGLHKADAGSVVVLDDTTGEVIAMASWPTYDPGEFVDGISQARYEELTDEGNGAPLTNRATSGGYAPGSTWKLVTATAALQSGLITGASTYDDRGTYEIPDCEAQCEFQNIDGVGSGRVNVSTALQVSSDVFFYDLGYRFYRERESISEDRNEVGGNAFDDTAEQLGFGASPGLDIGGDAAGSVANPEQRRSLHDQYPDKFPTRAWYPGDDVNLAIGQGDLVVTPLQLANAYATVANGGTRFSPNVGLEVREPGGGPTVRTVAPRVANQTVLSAEVRDPIMTGLSLVTTGQGTGAGAFAGWPRADYEVGGKTGTAEAGNRQADGTRTKQDTSLFVGVGPMDDPKYVVAVVMEQSGRGASAAAPVARAVMGQVSGVEPSIP